MFSGTGTKVRKNIASNSHAKVRRAGLNYDATINDATNRQTAIDALAGVGIITDV